MLFKAPYYSGKYLSANASVRKRIYLFFFIFFFNFYLLKVFLKKKVVKLSELVRIREFIAVSNTKFLADCKY